MASVQEFFEPHTKTIGDIFSGYNYYQIPDFQRPYSWEDEQIEKLWDDVNSAYESDDRAPYFLGPVILAKGKEKRYDVVDGQQRLTTLTILFCVLRDLYLKDLKDFDDKDHLKRLISDAVKSMTEDDYRMRLITQEHYGNLFEQEILNGVKFTKETLTKKEKRRLEYKFLNAALIFKEKLKEKGDAKKIQDFVKYLLNNVVMITITCSSTISAIRLFQTINTSGLELTNADLVKSYLYSTIKESEESEKKQFKASWQDIETIAQQNDEEIENLLNCYGYYLLARKFQKSLYEELEAEFKNKKRTANEVIYDFRSFTDHYDRMLNEKSKAINALRNLPDNVFWKSVLLTAKKESFEKFKELRDELVKLYYSYWVADYTTAKTRDLSIKLIDMIKKKKPFDDIKKEINEKIAKDKVIDRIKGSLKGQDVYNSRWLKPLLILIEYGQKEDFVYIEYSRNLHVDHILPEKWYKIDYWKERWTNKQADDRLNMLGNLTLLSGKKNIQASNNDFQTKKYIYRGIGHDGKTGFDISERIIRESDWTGKQVEERQEWLSNEAAKAMGIKFT